MRVNRFICENSGLHCCRSHHGLVYYYSFYDVMKIVFSSFLPLNYSTKYTHDASIPLPEYYAVHLKKTVLCMHFLRRQFFCFNAQLSECIYSTCNQRIQRQRTVITFNYMNDTPSRQQNAHGKKCVFFSGDCEKAASPVFSPKI